MVWLLLIVLLVAGAGVVFYLRTASAKPRAVVLESCPHLGLTDDTGSFLRYPTPEHRCYVNPDGERIDVVHQMSFCLTTEHQRCPWMAIYAPDRPTNRWEEIVQEARENAWPAARRGLLVAASWLVAMLQRAISGARPVLEQAGRDAGALARSTVERSTQVRGGGPLAALRASLAGLSSRLAEARRAEEEPVALAASVQADVAAEPVSPQELVAAGRAALQAGQRKLARGYFVKCTELAPDHADGWLWRSAVATTVQDSRLCMERLLSIDPSNARAQTALAWLGRRAGVAMGPKQAETPAAPLAGKPLPVVAVATPNGSQARLVTWSCASCRTENRVSEFLCRHCGATVYGDLGTGPEAGILRQGVAALQAGDEDLAYRAFTAACELNVHSELAWLFRGRSAETLEELASCLERALEINPTNARARADLASARQRLGWKEAERRRAEEKPKPVQPKRPSPLRWVLPAFVCLGLAALWGQLASSPSIPSYPIELDLNLSEPLKFNLFLLAAAGIGLMDLVIAMALALQSPDSRSWALLFGVGTVTATAFYRAGDNLLPLVYPLWVLGGLLVVSLLLTHWKPEQTSTLAELDLSELDRPRSKVA